MVESENQQEGECIQAEINPAEGILDKAEQEGTGRPETKPGAKTEVNDKNKQHVRLEGICKVSGKNVYLKNDPYDDEDEDIKILEHT